MGGAVARALLRSPLAPLVMITTRSSHPSWVAQEPAALLLVEADHPGANVRAIEGADVVVLGVRPEHLEALVTEVIPHLSEAAVVLSLSAGTSLARLEELLPERVGVVRAMANLPVDIGAGVIGTVSSARTTDAQLALVDALLEPAGLVLAVDEQQFEVITAVPGAGPAYVSYFIEALTSATVAQGLDAQTAQRIALAVVRGAIARLDATGEDPERVRRTMMHPGNVTDTSMCTLDEFGVPAAFEAAVAAGVERARRFNAEG